MKIKDIRESNDKIHASYLISMQKNGQNPEFVQVDFRVPSWGVAHPQALRKQIDTHPRIKELQDNGYINQKVVASWKSNPQAELDQLKNDLEGNNLSASQRQSHTKRVKELETAINILHNNNVTEDSVCWDGYRKVPGKKDYEKGSCQKEKRKVSEKEGGMSDKERRAYNRKHGSNLKRAQPSGGKRRTSYCARSKGQMDMHDIDCRTDPDKPICKARRDWNC